MEDKSFDTSWNVDKYFDDTEPEQHWELRRNFMSTNKEKYPEDYLVALSRVFSNVEFMGCVYPKAVMERVTELSEGIVESYREKKRQKLQRTFVKASDAAESRYSGNRQSHAAIGSTQYASSNQPETEKSYSSTTENPEQDSLVEKVRSQPGFLMLPHITKRGQLVFVKYTNEMMPFSMLNQAVSAVNGLKLEIQLSHLTPKHEKHFNLRIGDEIVAECTAPNEKEAKTKLAEIALETLQKTCFTIERKVRILASGETIQKKEEPLKKDQSLLKSDNIGLKMMKLMGWSGKGLGKDEDGREDNVEVKEQINRAGLGFSSNASNGPMIQRKMEDMIRKYANSNKTSNLVFSSDFSNEERKFLHRMAAKYHLKSRSYGKDVDGTRQLVIQRKITLWEIVYDLLKAGGSSELYNLLIPTDFQNSL